MKHLLCISLIVLLSGCYTPKNNNPEVMADLASQLKDISAAIDGTLKFSSEPYTDPHKLLLAAIKDDKSKLAPFENYQLRIVIQEKNAILLLCKEEILLIEDAGCSAKSDIQHWQSDKNQICKVTLKSNQVCKF